MNCRYYKNRNCRRFRKKCICRLECGDTYCSYREIKKKGEDIKAYLIYRKSGVTNLYLACIIVLGDILLVSLFFLYMANT